MTIWPKDNTVAKNAFYGNFQDKAWASNYLIRIHPPFVIYYDKKPMPAGVQHFTFQYLDPKDGRLWKKDVEIHPPRTIKLPAEVGLQVPHPAPKADGRTKAVRRNKPHPSGNKKYVISKAQLKAERPHLYP